MDHNNTFRAKKQIELLLENIHNPIGDYNVEEVGAMLGHAETKLKSQNLGDQEKVFIDKIEETMTRWVLSNWKSFPTSKEDGAQSATSTLQKAVARFQEDEASPTTQEVELMRGYVLGLRAYGNEDESTLKLAERLSDSNRRYDRTVAIRLKEEKKARTILIGAIRLVVVTLLIRNWYLVILIGALIWGGIYTAFYYEPPEPPKMTSDIDYPPGSEAAKVLDQRLVRPFRTTSRREERASAAIDRYIAENEEKGKSEEEEKNLYRIGNLYYSSVFDYKKAILAYTELIEKYPEGGKTEMAWVAMADCYAKMGDSEQEMETYKIISQTFPSESAAYKYATAKLEGKL